MNYANLIQTITENIKTNGSQAITAQVLQDVLVDMVGELGQSGALLGGVIDTSFVPDPTNDAQVVYIAESPGTYTNFNGLVVGAGEVAFFYFDGNAWAKSSVDVLEVVNNLTSTATDKALSAAMGKQLQDSLTQAVNDLTTAIGNKADRQTTEQALNTLQNQINDKADTTYVNSQLATKADTASVNAALALKADTSAVNAALATKADTSALATKADKVVGAVAGNMAGLDADGNLVDSGINSSAVGDVANKIDRVADAVEGNVAAFDSIGGIEDSGIPADNVAEQDGYYETMVVGGAENLIGSDIVSSQFTRRKTGGTADVGTGVAILKTIKGNTLVWNQICKNGNFADTSQWNGITVSGGVGTKTPSVGAASVQLYNHIQKISGHKYYIRASIKFSVVSHLALFRHLWYGGSTLSTALAIPPSDDTWKDYSFVVTGNANASSGEFNFIGDYQAGGAVSGDNMQAKNIVCIDLTAMGLASLTAAEFEAMFPLSYYAYDSGSLLNLTATGLQTNGFNQWDEEWEVGGYNTETGEKNSLTDRIRSKNFIPVISEQTYFFKNGDVNLVCLAYDAQKNFTGEVVYKVTSQPTYTIPSNVKYIRFYMVTAYGTTYKNDICINLSDVNKNGTYEKYWTETKALPITTATSGGVAIFSDGVKSAGTAYDEMTATKATKRIGVVDLGSLAWRNFEVSSGVFVFYTNASHIKANGYINVKCSKYATRQDENYSGAQWNLNDKEIGGAYSNGAIFIKDSAYYSYTTTQFKTAMNGIYAYFELPTHEDYTLDTPFNGQYKVDNDGCELVTPENGSTPTTAPFIADIQYALNATDTIIGLPKNYISTGSLENLLNALKTAGVITSFTMTWNSTTQKYTFTISH